VGGFILLNSESLTLNRQAVFYFFLGQELEVINVPRTTIKMLVYVMGPVY